MADGIQCGTIMTLISPGDCTLQCGMWLRSGIVTVNSPSGSTLQCDTWLWDSMPLNSPGGSTLQCGRWLWDDMPLNSPECPPYWNCTSGFDFDHHHRSRHVISFCNSLRNFIQIGPPSAEKMTLCRFSRWWISVILLNCLVFQKIAFLHFGVNIQDGGSPPSWIIGVQ